MVLGVRLKQSGWREEEALMGSWQQHSTNGAEAGVLGRAWAGGRGVQDGAELKRLHFVFPLLHLYP